MKTLLRKLKNKKGFTLMEMLIVVAIMVILVAVSIPVFTNQLDKAKEATDAANLRAAKSLALTMYMTEGQEFKTEQYYNIDTGKFQADSITKGYGESKDYEEYVITAVWDETNKEVKIDWKKVGSGS